MRAAIFLLLFSVAGAAQAKEPEVIQLSPDTYMIIRENKAGIFGSLPKTKIKVIKQANEFAAAQGKVAIPVSIEERKAGGPGQWPSVEYQFRVVDRSDPEAQRTSLRPAADVVVTVDPGPPTQTPDVARREDRDLYKRLLELDDLRKRGVLSEAEFEAEKRKLLESE